MESVNSTTYIKRPPYMTETQEKFLYTKELLTGRIFLGFYQERKYVGVLREYRDLVVISSEETELHQDVDKLIKKWLSAPDVKWVGITGPDSSGLSNSYCFWVKFENLPFGHYWFQIKHVKQVDGEVILHLKHIRKSRLPQTSDKKRQTEEETSGVAEDFDLKKILTSIQTTFLTSIQSHLSWANVVTTVKMLLALIIFIVLGVCSIISNLGDFTLKLIRELSNLVRELTPIIIQLIDFLSKALGGLYILIARMFFGRRVQSSARNVYSIPYATVASPSSYQSSDHWRERNQRLRDEFLSFR